MGTTANHHVGAAAAIMGESNRAPWAVRFAVRATHASRRIAVACGAMGARTFDSIDDGPHPDHLLRVVADDEEREDALDPSARSLPVFLRYLAGGSANTRLPHTHSCGLLFIVAFSASSL